MGCPASFGRPLYIVLKGINPMIKQTKGKKTKVKKTGKIPRDVLADIKPEPQDMLDYESDNLMFVTVINDNKPKKGENN
jgi:hypothetical protein